MHVSSTLLLCQPNGEKRILLCFWGWKPKQNKMKRLLLMLLLVASTNVFAQKEVTKFLGIPVDGFKSEMIQKLKAKGYKYNSTRECLEGEFNGREVEIGVVTNNNKVYRIAVFDKHYSNETDIKIRFNTLCGQFENNSRYFGSKEQRISDNDDISYEISVHNKRYEAVFYQTYVDDEFEDVINRPVWFMISDYYGSYKILMYYDNVYNQANGDDL